MAVTPQTLSPNMSYQQLIAALNANFSNVQNTNKTQILTDNTGVQRIIIGVLPDGTSGIVISKTGVNVVSLFTS